VVKKWRAGAVAGGLLVALLLVWLVVVVASGDPVTPRTMVDPLVRGARLNHTTIKQGVIEDPPYSLIGEATEILGFDVDEDTYALARSGRSEGVDGMEARMHIFLNQAAAAGLSVFQLTVRGGAKDGYFAHQAGRRWASDRDPYAGDVGLAQKVQADRAAGLDPTGGASNYYDVDAFGHQAGTGSEEAKRQEWLAKGLVPYYFPGASDNLVLWRPGTVPDGFDPAFA